MSNKNRNGSKENDKTSLKGRILKILGFTDEYEKEAKSSVSSAKNENIKCNRESSVKSDEFLQTRCAAASTSYITQDSPENTNFNESSSKQGSRVSLAFKSIYGKKSVSSNSLNIKSLHRPKVDSRRGSLNLNWEKDITRLRKRILKFVSLPDEHEEGESDDINRKDLPGVRPSNFADENYIPNEVSRHGPLYFSETNKILIPCKFCGIYYTTDELNLHECSSLIDATESVGDISPKVEEVTWNIDGFFMLSSNPGYRITSPLFTFMDHEWRLAMWPNGEIHTPGCMDLWLQRKGPIFSTLRAFNWTLGLKRGDGAVYSSVSGVENLDRMQCSWKSVCRGVFVSQTELLKQKNIVAPQDRLTIFCRLSLGTATELPEKMEASAILTNLSNNLKELLVSEEDADVAIEIKDKKFKAHRAILRARTPVLHAMFSHDMVENNSGVISVVDCDPSAFQEFLLFVYSGKVENLSDDNVLAVYYTADKYNVPELKKECVRYMRTALSCNSICDVVCLATRYGEHELLQDAMHFFADNVQEILLTVQWQQFMHENSVQANELLIKSFKTTGAEKQ